MRNTFKFKLESFQQQYGLFWAARALYISSRNELQLSASKYRNEDPL